MKTYAIAQHSPNNGEVSMNGTRWFIVGSITAEDARQAATFWRMLDKLIDRDQQQQPRIIATNHPAMVAVAASRYERVTTN